MDWNLLFGGLGMFVTAIGVIYAMLRNFKGNIEVRIQALEKGMQDLKSRMNVMESFPVGVLIRRLM